MSKDYANLDKKRLMPCATRSNGEIRTKENRGENCHYCNISLQELSQSVTHAKDEGLRGRKLGVSRWVS